MITYPAKLLLFGEHTVNLGSQALAIPLPLFSGRWEYLPQLSKEDLSKRQMQLPALALYIRELKEKGELLLPVDIDAFENALRKGLVFISDIPVGYGVGSSGALIAAIIGKWVEKRVGVSDGNDLVNLKKGLAQLECFFHGTSSGIDPLISFIRRPIMLNEPGKDFRIVKLPVNRLQYFLIDTGIHRNATAFIEYFLEENQQEEFNERCKRELFPAIGRAISSLMNGDEEGILEGVHLIGSFQFQYLNRLIPNDYSSIWQDSLNSEYFKLKVCGAGGGGFILGVTKDYKRMEHTYHGLKIIPIANIDH